MKEGKNGPFLITRALTAFFYKTMNHYFSTRPKLKHIQNQIQEDVKKSMSQQFRMPTIGSGCSDSKRRLPKPNFLASCSTFGPQGTGVVIRIASTTTESVYNFLRHQLASMDAFLGASPYC